MSEIKKDLEDEINKDIQLENNDEVKENEAVENDVKNEEIILEENSDSSDNDSKRKDKTSKLKKNKKDKKDEQIDDLKDRLVRNMAEFDNFRKRTEKEKAQMFEIGAKSIVERILPVVDNFERALSAVSDEEKENPFVQGIDKIYKHMMSCLEEAGVTPIEAVGKEFDPEYHNAVMHDEDDTLGENVVSEELQKGYMYKESVVRHSMVKVVN